MKKGERKQGIIAYNPIHKIHKASMVSRENPQRLERGFKFIKNRSEILDFFDIIQDYEPADREDLEKVHEETYIDFMEKYCKKGGGFLGDSTYVQKGTCKAARYSAGGAIEVGRQMIENGYKTGFGLIRPPGHHATPDKYGGYCIYNNAAVAARWLQERGKEKIMIVDWDGHACNGTMRCFYDDPSVLVISTHRDPESFYPHDGFSHQIGKGEGKGYTANICLPSGAGDKEFQEGIEEIVIPLAEQFDPDFVIGCNGFDSHYSDSVVDLNLTAKSYHYIASVLTAEYKNKAAVLLEGGYEEFNGKLLNTLLSGLAEQEKPYEDEANALSTSIMQQGNVHKITRENIEELKDTLSDFALGSEAFR